ncbi:hypothetical protein GCM10011348_12510 [Marinobacterium nitratireducens]|uniref:Uncharacterized protein n=1 Tax=Marinobacterium nitratireducens TaxID=518897 RepID=A0A917ZC77_9GAMM|nr:hypothetical protein [Marinobacterium nitratireducens]GGO79087.1 hypothetical protein GCM10011348_12510 [Marinobacterium nitratireducens]
MHMRTLMPVGLILVAAMMLPGTALSAGGGAPPHEQLQEAWRQVDDLLEGFLAPQQQQVLNDLSYATAVDGLCDSFDVDRAKFVQAFDELTPQADDYSADEAEHFKQHLLFSYGLVMGLFMAEGALDQTGFCRQAQAHRDDPETPHFWE